MDEKPSQALREGLKWKAGGGHYGVLVAHQDARSFF